MHEKVNWLTESGAIFFLSGTLLFSVPVFASGSTVSNIFYNPNLLQNRGG